MTFGISEIDLAYVIFTVIALGAITGFVVGIIWRVFKHWL